MRARAPAGQRAPGPWTELLRRGRAATSSSAPLPPSGAEHLSGAAEGGRRARLGRRARAHERAAARGSPRGAQPCASRGRPAQRIRFRFPRRARGDVAVLRRARRAAGGATREAGRGALLCKGRARAGPRAPCASARTRLPHGPARSHEAHTKPTRRAHTPRAGTGPARARTHSGGHGACGRTRVRGEEPRSSAARGRGVGAQVTHRGRDGLLHGVDPPPPLSPVPPIAFPRVASACRFPPPCFWGGGRRVSL